MTDRIYKNIRKKTAAIMLLMFAGIMMITGCGSENSNKKISIVCTIYPQYDWVKQIVGDRYDEYDITLLIENGTDMHSYQPSAKDIAKLSTCDLFIYIGGEADEWVEQALKNAKNKDMKTVKLMDVLGNGVVEEDCIIDHDHSIHENESGHSHVAANEEQQGSHSHEDEETVYDEHVWLSLKNAQLFVDAVYQQLITLDSEAADVFEKNSHTLINEMKALDSEINDYVKDKQVKTLVFADRFPFIYFTRDYGIEYYAAFPGCSAETEASFETIVKLSKVIDEKQLGSICVLENSDGKLADTVKKNTVTANMEIVRFDSMQSVTKKDIEAGKTYMDYMKANFESLKGALK